MEMEVVKQFNCICMKRYPFKRGRGELSKGGENLVVKYSTFFYEILQILLLRHIFYKCCRATNSTSRDIYSDLL